MSILDKIFDAGIVGCGGAGFPTHIKYKAGPEIFIVNGAECEPLLRTDRFLMKNESRKIVAAVAEIAEALGAARAVIALKETYKEEIEALEYAVKELESTVEIFKFKNFYPAGDEQVLVYEVTGKIVPPAGLPLDVGAVVSNVATVHAVYNATQDINFTDKYLTVTGEVEHPVIVKAPIGTSIETCIMSGGIKNDEYDFIIGGPMMGKIYDGSEAGNHFVTKTTSGIIVLKKGSRIKNKSDMPVAQMLRRAKSACIQCSFCTEMCPRHMLGHPIKPNLIMRKLAYFNDVEEILDDKNVKQALICSECGVCEEYACPMGLQPRKINKMIKNIYAGEKIRYDRPDMEFDVNPMREYRQIPGSRIAARLELSKYYHYEINDLEVIDADKVSIAVKQHIGKPSVPVVKTGDAVRKGQLIAECEEGAMGANIHASIDGKVVQIGENIVIER